MSDFSFSTTAGASQSTTKPKLEGNMIHTVKFDGCEIKDVVGVKDPTATYEQLILKFSNEDGAFDHTVWPPRPEDFTRRESEITNKNGKKEKIPQPSNVESMMLFFKHAIDTLNPTIAKQIDSKEKKITAPDWNKLRELIVSILEKGKGVETKIKLMKNSKTGEAVFPGFFAGLTREGVAYVRNNFIGDKIAFSTYELEKINKEASAAPAKVQSFISDDLTATEIPSDAGMDLNFEVGDL